MNRKRRHSTAALVLAVAVIMIASVNSIAEQLSGASNSPCDDCALSRVEGHLPPLVVSLSALILDLQPSVVVPAGIGAAQAPRQSLSEALPQRLPQSSEDAR
ncbi:hypothetical protein [Oceanobacter kriegii]|uniref:hypothetical protein n=1 Tax=Oceanobacter kriegii TaxID=64972 RepID=UPI000408FB7F|nr:hypothetical protein [Oceanobacter kriegii]